MFYLFVWWLILLLIGLVALPVTLGFFRFLPDRGYAFAKPLGLLLAAYPFWLLTSLGFLQNTFGSIALILAAVAGAAWAVSLLRRDQESPLAWLRSNWRHALAVEIVFALAFFAFAYFRAFNPEISATEKPMDFMFVNSILRSAQFPPHDAWLSGFSISYYYFGYLIVALLTRLTAVPSNYTFNLGLTMVFALSATGAFGLVFNLVRGGLDPKDSRARGSTPGAAYAFGALAVFLLLIVGNLEGVAESLHNAGVGGPSFYQWLDINGLADAPTSGSLIPQDNWWWWRASRVVNDHNPTNGDHIEVIDEFPAFSFLLGDLHPHVIALPFGLLALAVALNLLRRPPGGEKNLFDTAASLISPEMLLTVVVVGALGFLNTWDIVTYGWLVTLAYGVTEYRSLGRWSTPLALRTALFGIGLFIVSYLFYLPFYLGFSSQVRGIAPTVFFRTPLNQYLIMFGLFVFVLVSFVAVLMWQQREALNPVLREAGAWALVLLLVPVFIAVVGVVVLAASPPVRDQVASLLGAPSPGNITTQVLGSYFHTLVSRPGVFVLLTALLAGSLAVARQRVDRGARPDASALTIDTSVVFALLLAFTGFLLTFGVEFLYVRDTFEDRMNTVFKLYYQAWVLFSVASAFGVYYIWKSTRGPGAALWSGAFTVLFGLSLVYPVLAVPNRTGNLTPNAAAGLPTLDGTLWIKNSFPDDYAAIEWMNAHAPDDAVILEATGQEYSFYDRVSVATGLQTVLGWGGHELQWRGNGDEAARREPDIRAIYQGLNTREVQTLLTKYHVSYVIVGGLERQQYGLTQPMIDKFGKIGQLVFSQGGLRIYQVSS